MSNERSAAELREFVVARAFGCCEYCQSQARFATQSFSMEHIIPRNKGGHTTLENLALSCQGCNNHKYNKTVDRDPVTNEMVSLFHPRQQRWQEHFVWNHDYTEILGITPTGRATVVALHQIEE